MAQIDNMGKGRKNNPAMKSAEDGVSKMIRWRRNMASFVREAIGVPSISTQQLDACAKVDAIIECRLQEFCGNEIPAHLEGYRGKFGLSIMSGQGTGKDAWSAWLIIFMLVCFPRPKLLATAPAAHQLKSVLWAEVSKWLNLVNDKGERACPLYGSITVQTEKIYVTETGGKESFCEGRTCNPNTPTESQAETLAGRHEDYMVMLVDEASKVPDAVFRPIEGTMSGKCNFAVLIFNPTRRTGYAIKSHYGPDSRMWVKLHWDAELSEITSKENIDKLAKKYGKTSNAYRVRVKGLPPIAEDGSLIPWDVATEATQREMDVPDDEPTIMSVDVGRQGDPSVIYVRKGPKTVHLEQFREADLTMVAGRVMVAMDDWEPDGTIILVCGLGWGVFDIVRKHKDKVYAVNEAGASRSEKFDRLRDEMWWNARGRFMTGTIQIPEDDDLVSELTTPKYEVLADGKIKVESKRQMKARQVDSPNKADALVASFALPESMFRKSAPNKGRERYKGRGTPEEHGEHGWMSC